MKWRRILLKLSGEALQGKAGHGIDEEQLLSYVKQITRVARQGAEIGIVIGGGNFFRGLSGVNRGFDRVKGDYMGMLATVINGLGLQSAFEAEGQKARLLTAFRTEPVGEAYSKDKVQEAFANKEVVIFSGGTGNPYFTTDTASALRAVEMEADVLLKGTRVDGIYTADPEKDPNAEKYPEITFDQAYAENLKIMDMTAFTMCKENNLPIVVFDMNTEGNLQKLMQGATIGSIVKNP